MSKEKQIWEQPGYDFDPPYPASTPVITNYDRLISKTPEELAKIMVGDCPPNYPHGDCREYEKYDGNLDCCKCWLDWLKSPVEVNDGA